MLGFNIKKFIKENKLFNNFTTQFIGQNLSAVLQLINLSLLISYLGAEKNGVLISVQVYCYLMSDLLSVQSASSIIAYVSESLKDKNKVLAITYIKIGFLLDILLGAVAAIIGYLLLDLSVKYFNWSKEISGYISVYLFVCFFRFMYTGTALGILRLREKYFQISIVKNIYQLLRLVSIGFYFYSTPGIYTVILIELILECARDLLFLLFAIMETNKILPSIEENRGVVKPEQVKSFIKFNLANGISLTADVILGHLSSLYISKFVGFDSVTIFRVLERIGGVFLRFTAPLSEVLYPEICVLISEGKGKIANNIVKKLSLGIFSSTSIVLILLGVFYENWMTFFVTNPQDFYILTVYALIFAGFNASVSAFHQLFMAYRFVKVNSYLTVILNIIYLCLLSKVLSSYGLEGMVLLQLSQSIIMIAFKYLYFSIKLKKSGYSVFVN
ncbi:MAG: O-antigen/teichoic acid export membrane protein [Bacteriovoracaceae bacterium]|jgi:O-antigen/teichoic acid export membrane protein